LIGLGVGLRMVRLPKDVVGDPEPATSGFS
jgi:hypothetical protein